MFLETVKSEGLAQISYVLGDEGAGTCAVIDPRRDVEAYLEVARRRQVRIAFALETHVHADFVSGSRELRRRTGCVIRGGPSDHYGFEIEPLVHEETVSLGDLRLRALHTPGHSPEHLSFAASIGDEPPWTVFTGDALFAGSVGRPDLAAGLDEEEQARRLFHSLREVLLPLGGDVVVRPGHGSGSPCGADIGEREVTTLGYEERTSPKLSISREEDFVEAVLGDLPDEPAYYRRMKRVNTRGDERAGPPPDVPALVPDAFEEVRAEEDALVLDLREIEAFGGAHMDGAWNVALRSSFPVWAGRMVEPGRSLLLVAADPDEVGEAVLHLHRIGLDHVHGFLAGGMRSWIESGREWSRRRDLTVHGLRECLDDGLRVLDVRSPAEWEEGHVPGARHLHVTGLAEAITSGTVPAERDRPVAVYCGSGYRSSLASSLLEAAGWSDVRNVPGSISAWTAAGYSLEAGAE